METVTIGATVIGKLARRDEQHRPVALRARELCRDKSKCGGPIAPGGRDDLVQGAICQASLREMRIDFRKAEGEDPRCAGQALHSRQQTAQLLHDLGAASIAIRGWVIGWLHDATRVGP